MGEYADYDLDFYTNTRHGFSIYGYNERRERNRRATKPIALQSLKGNDLMVNKTQTFVIRGKAMYAKILGDPIPNYDKSGKEWKMDLQLTDKNSLKELKAAGIGDRAKTNV